jgi:hypothetical protein
MVEIYLDKQTTLPSNGEIRLVFHLKLLDHFLSKNLC